MQRNDPSILPLVVDLDGTLTPTDTLVESVLLLVKRQPWCVFLLLAWLLLGRSSFKSRVAARVDFAAEALPWRTEFVQWIQDERDRGRRVILATAAHERVAQKVAEYLGLFDEVLSTRDGCNLKGAAKLKAIHEQVGADFVYAGDSAADLSVWAGARAAVLVGASATVSAAAAKIVPVEKVFAPRRLSLKVWVKAIRVHQWLKNLLLFVPWLTSFSFTNSGGGLELIFAFAAFSLAASGTYVLNDLSDLASDRQHPRKRFRAFAGGELSIVQGMLAAGTLLLLGFASATLVSIPFVLMLAGYVILTTIYSWVLKQYVLMDVLALAILYTYRVLAGAVVIGVPVSAPLLAFSAFLFLSLALVKRCSELVSLRSNSESEAKGRDYRVGDLAVLWPFGVGASLCAVLVFGIYISSPETAVRYREPMVLWGVAVSLTYWLARLWVKTARGEMHDDPIVYALKDRGSRVAVASMVALTIFAHFKLPGLI